MKKILRVGIAGFGVVGKRRKFYIDKNPKFEVIAISDISFKKTIEKKKKIIYLKKYKDLLKQDIDVLFVCLPNRYASQATIDGLRNNIHVFCEKPPGRTVKEIKKVIIQEKRKKLIKLKYGFNHRYHTLFCYLLFWHKNGKKDTVIVVKNNLLFLILGCH